MRQVCDVPDHRESAQVAQNRGNVYRLLSLIFAREPGPDLLNSLREGELKQILVEAGVDLEDAFWVQPIETVEDELAVEYTRLFLGPGRHLSPHESVWVGAAEKGDRGLLWGEATADVVETMNAFGFDLLPCYSGIPDHLAVELELMHHLARKESDAWNAGDRQVAEEYRGYQRKFMEEHLIRWVPRFCDLVADLARIRFYRDIARLTKDFVLDDWEFLAESVVQ